jgi:hypothetical protein
MQALVIGRSRSSVSPSFRLAYEPGTNLVLAASPRSLAAESSGSAVAMLPLRAQWKAAAPATQFLLWTVVAKVCVQSMMKMCLVVTLFNQRCTALKLLFLCVQQHMMFHSCACSDQATYFVHACACSITMTAILNGNSSSGSSSSSVGHLQTLQASFAGLFAITRCWRHYGCCC